MVPRYLLATVLVAVALLASWCSASTPIADTPGFALGTIASYSLLSQSNGSALYSVDLAAPATSDYQYPIYLISLSGSRYQMGYDCTPDGCYGEREARTRS